MLPPTKPIYYLASPFTHADKEIESKRHHKAVVAVGMLLKIGMLAYSPIVHNVPVSYVAGMGGTWGDWQEYDLAMLNRCDELLVLGIPGWEDSIGVRAEVKQAASVGKPIHLLHIDAESQLIKILPLLPAQLLET